MAYGKTTVSPTLCNALCHPFYKSHVKTSCERSRLPRKCHNSNDTICSDYKAGPLDHMILSLFRRKMVQEVGWDSAKPGYDGMVDVANFLLNKYKSRLEVQQASVRILRTMFPPFFLLLFRKLIAPLAGGKVAALLIARVTVSGCQWLMGKTAMKILDLPDGSSSNVGVVVERCKYLEESKCAGVCIHTCKLPTQSFMQEEMGVPLYMEPNFDDFSCEFKFGIPPPSLCDDTSLQVSCLEICPTSSNKRASIQKCPKV